ncbi:MAG TPA: 2-phospho-L-lactate transferase [Thermoleophilaceae bacterium]|nr:2-phospho-L-lactate transferase [Thermoleophilaceae bacterium]
MVVVLAGGSGGAKLARGLYDVLGPGRLTAVVNTADDVEAHGVHVSPDPDLVTYWLSGAIDEERGYGIEDDTWEVMAALEAAGRPAWFRLGDRDLAMCLIRTELLRDGERLTVAHAEVVRGLGVQAQVLPMCDQPVRTHVRRDGLWRAFQEFMILDRAEGTIEEVAFHGAEHARITPEVRDALAHAEAIVVGPSNPVISIGPILAVPGMRETIAASPAPVLAVSPFVAGRAVKGPTDAFCEHAGIGLGAEGIARHYEGLLDGLVADEAADGVRTAQTDTLMDTDAARRRVASFILEFAAGLAG